MLPTSLLIKIKFTHYTWQDQAEIFLQFVTSLNETALLNREDGAEAVEGDSVAVVDAEAEHTSARIDAVVTTS